MIGDTEPSVDPSVPSLTEITKLLPPVIAAVKVPGQVSPVISISFVVPSSFFVPTVFGENEAASPSTRASWHSFAIDARRAFAAEFLALSACPRKVGSAMDARMPMITITTSNSIKVKPRLVADPERLDWEMVC